MFTDVAWTRNSAWFQPNNLVSVFCAFKCSSYSGVCLCFTVALMITVLLLCKGTTSWMTNIFAYCLCESSCSCSCWWWLWSWQWGGKYFKRCWNECKRSPLVDGVTEWRRWWTTSPFGFAASGFRIASLSMNFTCNLGRWEYVPFQLSTLRYFYERQKNFDSRKCECRVILTFAELKFRIIIIIIAIRRSFSDHRVDAELQRLSAY